MKVIHIFFEKEINNSVKKIFFILLIFLFFNYCFYSLYKIYHIKTLIYIYRNINKYITYIL
ncbi:hypothetical protein BCR32DRAFT_48254 [Anaeromyces robustus]|uniref:Uncharacterized protein n=1 Tax=Anaeromyces robustus TaxID=1754192 RepID=A0A1Y1WYH7_9FUNG|nr:hypothetical protein BCR32DRAFT_48254 [Anaeromyces robustus]|eukprot:ORX78445.1 hypothetical protein BCR32DRAFT_48254 [Anaeromyces robustus]